MMENGIIQFGDGRIILTKDSTAEQLRAYFEFLLKLYRSNEKYPVDLDSVWMVVYSRRDKALASLREIFIEGVDYNLHQEGKVVSFNDLRNGVKVTASLTVECFEYFIARKVRKVFDVYRSVFHDVAIGKVVALPQDYASALRELADQVERNQQLLLENKQQATVIAEQKPKVVFADAIVGSQSSCLIGELAKIITQNGYKIGQNRLFEWLRNNHFLGTTGEYYNIPNQKYVEQGLFEIKKTSHSENGVMKTTSTPKVLPKGQLYFVNMFLKGTPALFDDGMILPDNQ